MYRPRVAFDWDDFIADLTGHMLPWHDKKYGTSLAQQGARTYDYSRLLGLDPKETLQRTYDFLHTPQGRRLPALPGSKRLVADVARRAEPVIVTARAKDLDDVTRENAEAIFPGVFEEIIHINSMEGPDPYPSKAVACAQHGIVLMMDDNLDNLRGCVGHTPRINAIFYDRWAQQSCVDAGILHARTHRQVLAHAVRVLDALADGKGAL